MLKSTGKATSGEVTWGLKKAIGAAADNRHRLKEQSGNQTQQFD